MGLRPKNGIRVSGRLRGGQIARFEVAGLEMFDGGDPLVAQMREQDVAEFAAGAAAQRLQDGLVFAHRFPPTLALAGKIGGVAHPPDSPGEVRVGALECRVARGFDDLLVDQLVDVLVRRQPRKPRTSPRMSTR